MKVNYHTHTPRCGHAVGNDAFEYAKAAYEYGIEILGFSEHAPFPNCDFGCRMPYEELQAYFEDVDTIRQMYQGRMKVLKGLEIEYLPEYVKENNFYEYLLNDCKCDYLLLGEHFFRDQEGALYNLYNIDRQELVLDYARCCAEAMKTGYFDIVAHPDLFGVNAFPWNEIYDRATDIIIDAAVKTDTILEFNANGYRRGLDDYNGELRYKYPLERFWEKVKTAPVRVVIGSDAHNPKEIYDAANVKAEKYLKELHIEPIDIWKE